MDGKFRFEWDNAKSRANLLKHGVAFEEASSAFVDDQGLLIDDPDHSIDEERFILIGMSSMLRVVVVVHSYREQEAAIRIISARKATRWERLWYAREWKHEKEL